jgi:hypothetical protein
MIRQRAVLAAAFDAGAADVVPVAIDVRSLATLPGNASRGAPQSGTKALMLAVLDNGVASYLSHEPRVRSEAECWVLSPQRHSPFSFTVVCETLGLDPNAVRTALQRLRHATGGAQALTAGRRRGSPRPMRLSVAKPRRRIAPARLRRSAAARIKPSVSTS